MVALVTVVALALAVALALVVVLVAVALVKVALVVLLSAVMVDLKVSSPPSPDPPEISEINMKYFLNCHLKIIIY